jgi:hypothetical protein
MCDLIAATREVGWVAIKITPHQHPGDGGPDTDTARYLAAGAAEAHLLIGPVPLKLPGGEHRIIESNSILDLVTPDLVFFVVDPSKTEWKASALRYADLKQHIVVDRLVAPEHIALLRSRL